MKLNKWVVFLIIFTFLNGCIKRFDPDLNNDVTSKYVVQGMVSSIEGWQNISISRTSMVTNPEYFPVNNCVVNIIDDLGNSFLLAQYDDGEYRVWMNSADLVPGHAYKVVINTPDEETLESSFDQMPKGPEVGDVFYEIKDLPTNTEGEFIHGIQFYTNLIADESESRYYRWKLTETWEYHSQYPKIIYYNGSLQEFSPPDWSENVCYRTLLVDQIFTLSTKNLEANAFNNFPLHFVDNATSRLSVLYSLLIEQIALSEPAYNYWEDLGQNSSQDGGLYNTQPITIIGNVVNLTNPDKDVLGFFQASTVFSNRIFVQPEPEFELDFDNGCSATELGMGGFNNISPSQYPAYMLLGEEDWLWMKNACVDCTDLGGTTDKPSYWPL